ncbi:hypothetical protein E3A20_27190 [Planctomyces bekefii]|uniref:DUF4360 domain-containing protein n=1 Tax=Planctomyces bekefii TaxID=1653850 RepID=A0A5C6M295_9PLAN|nr:hypothetical protein E3A20_27190 [Planctomyces bekefii]
MFASLKNLVKVGAPLLIAAATFAGAAQAQVPNYVRVRNISWAGSGCPAGSVAQNVSPDLQAFTLLFDSYIAQVGPGVPIVEKRKNCQLSVDLDFPQGWSYTIFTVDTRGYASLEPGVNGLQQSRYYFMGSAATGTLKTPLVGPVDRDYQIRDVLGLSALVWSPCGATRALNINTEVRLDNSCAPGASGMMTIDSIDGNLKLIYGIQWRRC